MDRRVVGKCISRMIRLVASCVPLPILDAQKAVCVGWQDLTQTLLRLPPPPIVAAATYSPLHG